MSLLLLFADRGLPALPAGVFTFDNGDAFTFDDGQPFTFAE